MTQWEFCEVYWVSKSWTPYSPHVADSGDSENNAIKHELALVQIEYNYEVGQEHTLTTTSENLAAHYGEKELKDTLKNDKNSFREKQKHMFTETNFRLPFITRSEIAKLGLMAWEIVTVTKDSSHIDEHLVKGMENLMLHHYMKRAINP